MRNIAVSLNAGTPSQRNEITKLFAKDNWAYWHWIDDFWIVQVPDSITPQSLHDGIEALPDIGLATILVFEFHGTIEFWGRCEDDAWKWLNNIGSPSTK